MAEVAYLAAALFGIPTYVCEGAEVPLTFALVKMGVGIGPAFTFMLGAVGTCIPTIGMVPKIIVVPATNLYVVMWLILAFGPAWLWAFSAPKMKAYQSRYARRSRLEKHQLTDGKAMLVMGPDTKIKADLIAPPEAPAIFIHFLDWQVKQ